MRSPWVVGQPIVGLLVYLYLCTGMGSPAGGRFRESRRPAGAAVGCGRSAGVRARGSRHAAFVFGGRSHPPAARGPEEPLSGGDGSRYAWIAVEGSDFEASVSTLLNFAARSLLVYCVS